MSEQRGGCSKYCTVTFQSRTFRMKAGASVGSAMKKAVVAFAWSLLAVLFLGCGITAKRNAFPRSYDGLTKSEIRAKLPSDSFALIDALSDVPTGWPHQIRHIGDAEAMDQKRSRVLTWRMSIGDTEWSRVYSYGLDVYLKQHRLEPAMIYERRSTKHGTDYIPAMVLYFDSAGRAARSSREWCDGVIRAKETSSQE